MNGVVTYAKKGTVVNATSRPFGDASLDDQGRCVMTDHGNFVVFNVYVPASGGTSCTRKMKFLQQLRRAMQQQRLQHGKAVMLVGDLNISHGPLDVYWKQRVLHINDILREVEQHASNNTKDTTDSSVELPAWKIQLADAWPLVTEMLQTKQVLPTQTTNPKTGAKYDRYRLAVTMDNPTRTVYLGKHESSEDYCCYGYCFEIPEYYTDPETEERLLACEANVVSIEVVAELMVKIAKCNDWSDDHFLKQHIAPNATRARVNPFRQWLNELLRDDDMVDVFRHLHPQADARFTCWHQFTNTRYTNNGTRIDYTIVDRSLLPFVESGGPLRTGELWSSSLSQLKRQTSPKIQSDSAETTTTIATASSTTSILTDNTSVATLATLSSSDSPQTKPSDNHTTTTNSAKEPKKEMDPISEEAALAAATAKGQFEPVSFEGGGIVEATQHALDTQFGPPHTGIIYTPPSYSDHVAVSILLGDNSTAENNIADVVDWRSENWGNLILNEKDPDTRRSQPHKAQKSIASFFGSSTASTSTKPKFANSNQKFLPKKKKVNTLRSFFQPKPK